MAFRRNKNVRLEQFIDGSWKTCKTVKLGKGHSLYEQRKAEGVLMRLYHFQGPNKGSWHMLNNGLDPVTGAKGHSAKRAKAEAEREANAS